MFAKIYSTISNNALSVNLFNYGKQAKQQVELEISAGGRSAEK